MEIVTDNVAIYIVDVESINNKINKKIIPVIEQRKLIIAHFPRLSNIFPRLVRSSLLIDEYLIKDSFSFRVSLFSMAF